MNEAMVDPVQLLTEAYRGFNAREIDAVLALMHSDVDWPNGMEGGRVHGHQQVRDYWTRQWGMINPRVDPVSFQSGDAIKPPSSSTRSFTTSTDCSSSIKW